MIWKIPYFFFSFFLNLSLSRDRPGVSPATCADLLRHVVTVLVSLEPRVNILHCIDKKVLYSKLFCQFIKTTFVVLNQ